jgi:2-polyprenyl-3-methyl-5-hydroxy-6-metoxy-1,4-benzoquinol methylase
MDNIKDLKSPVTGSKNISREKTIKSKEIIDRYLTEYNFDVSHYFKGIDNIDVLKCEDTGYTFYYPFTIQGNEDLYQHLEHLEFYYLQNRWEFKIPPIFSKAGAKLLEIGCGNGHALKLYKENGIDCTGLELNSDAISNCEQKGLSVFNKTVEEFSLNHSESFDIVCAFQLLEHLSDINSFLTASIKLLKPNGYLIISVPNNNSFGHIFNTLNLPPHHMGLWKEESFSALTKYFSINLKKIYYTPLDKEQKKDLKVHYKNVLGKMPIGIRSISRFSWFFNFFVPKRKKGYTIVAVFQKS